MQCKLKLTQSQVRKWRLRQFFPIIIFRNCLYKFSWPWYSPVFSDTFLMINVLEELIDAKCKGMVDGVMDRFGHDSDSWKYTPFLTCTRNSWQFWCISYSSLYWYYKYQVSMSEWIYGIAAVTLAKCTCWNYDLSLQGFLNIFHQKN